MGLVFIKGHVCFEIQVTEKAKKNNSTLLHTFFRICPQLFLHQESVSTLLHCGVAYNVNKYDKIIAN